MAPKLADRTLIGKRIIDASIAPLKVSDKRSTPTTRTAPGMLYGKLSDRRTQKPLKSSQHRQHLRRRKRPALRPSAYVIQKSREHRFIGLEMKWWLSRRSMSALLRMQHAPSLSSIQ